MPFGTERFQGVPNIRPSGAGHGVRRSSIGRDGGFIAACRWRGWHVGCPSKSARIKNETIQGDGSFGATVDGAVGI